MFLIISEIYLFLFRTHVKLKDFRLWKSFEHGFFATFLSADLLMKESSGQQFSPPAKGSETGVKSRYLREVHSKLRLPVITAKPCPPNCCKIVFATICP